MTQPQKGEGERIEYAPTCGASPGVISVVVGEDEEVRWSWTHYPDGRSVVTGYEIVKKDPDAGGEEFSFERAVTDWLWPDASKGRARQTGSAPDSSSERPRKRAGFLSSLSARR